MLHIATYIVITLNTQPQLNPKTKNKVTSTNFRPLHQHITFGHMSDNTYTINEHAGPRCNCDHTSPAATTYEVRIPSAWWTNKPKFYYQIRKCLASIGAKCVCC